MYFFSCSSLKCVSVDNLECRIMPQIISVKSNEFLFYPYIIEVNKLSGSCSNINDPCVKLCVHEVFENISIILMKQGI